MKRRLQQDRLQLKIGRREGAAEGRLAVFGLLALVSLELGLRIGGVVVLMFTL